MYLFPDKRQEEEEVDEIFFLTFNLEKSIWYELVEWCYKVLVEFKSISSSYCSTNRQHYKFQYCLICIKLQNFWQNKDKEDS